MEKEGEKRGVIIVCQDKLVGKSLPPLVIIISHVAVAV